MKSTTTQAVKKKIKYRPVLALPPLSYEDFTALRDNIAVNGVLVPIVVDSTGSLRRIIDGNYRKQIADELDYDCPEVVQEGLEDDEKRTLARALNLARRHMTTEQKRKLVAQQLEETPERSNRWIGKQLGVHHATVASVRTELEATGQIIQLPRTVGEDGKSRPVIRQIESIHRTPAERTARIAATRLIHGDCRKELKKLATGSVDAVISDPIYPEVRPRGVYHRISETEWHAMMKEVVTECRRVLKPKGSAVFILQPNAKRMGEMRLWLWEFVVWAAKEWNLIEDVYWWAFTALPTRGVKREFGLMRPSVKMCVWIGPANCYRNQDKVLWTPSDALAARNRSDRAMRIGPSGRCYKNNTITKSADERGGVTPFNLLPFPTASGDSGDHPAATPYEVAAWWAKYILPAGGVLLDCFCGSGTMLVAGLDEGASKVIGIDHEKTFLEIAKRRIEKG